MARVRAFVPHNYNTAVSRISSASGVIHFCMPWPGSAFSVTSTTPNRSRTWMSRFSFFARLLIEPGVSLTCLRKSTRFAVRTCRSDATSSIEITRLDGIRYPLSSALAILRPRSKIASSGSTRISVLRTFELLCQPHPVTEPRASASVLSQTPMTLCITAVMESLS